MAEGVASADRRAFLLLRLKKLSSTFAEAQLSAASSPAVGGAGDGVAAAAAAADTAAAATAGAGAAATAAAAAAVVAAATIAAADGTIPQNATTILFTHQTISSQPNPTRCHGHRFGTHVSSQPRPLMK
ncbi:unnamed protein product [Closterium sp. NIES-54]